MGRYPSKRTNKNLMKIEILCEGKIKRAQWLSQEVGYPVGKRRIKRLMEVMGLETVYPKPNTSVPNKEHAVFLIYYEMLILPNQIRFGLLISLMFE